MDVSLASRARQRASILSPRPGLARLELSYTTRDINDDAKRWLAKAAAPARTGQLRSVNLASSTPFE
jgi:hypothetical protein